MPAPDVASTEAIEETVVHWHVDSATTTGILYRCPPVRTRLVAAMALLSDDCAHSLFDEWRSRVQPRSRLWPRVQGLTRMRTP
jgi:hypothetical protein